MPLNPLNHHYAIENPASIYDEEAMTALELAGRTTAKVNETVEAFNSLEMTTTQHIEDQAERLEKQEKEVIPNTVRNTVQNHINNGDFDRQIDEYMDGLSDRVDNLLGSVSEGTTSMDAEVIDVRTDMNGVAHVNAGTAVRHVDKHLNKRINYTGIGKNLLTVYWEQGLFNAADMTNYTSDVAVRSMGVIPCPHGYINVGIPSGLKLNVYSYKYANGAYSYLGMSDWMTGEKKYYLKAGATHCKMIAKYADGSEITPNDAGGIVIYENLEFFDNLYSRMTKVTGLVARMVRTTVNPDNKNSTGDLDCANTKRWFISEVYPAGVLLRSIEFYTTKTRDLVKIEIWDKDGDTLTLAKTVNSYGVAGQIVTADLNHFTTGTTMVSIQTPEACVAIDNDATGELVLAHADLTSTEIDITESTNFGGYLICASVNYDTYITPGKCPNVITVGPDMEFEEIQDALDSIPFDDLNHYTIEVYPRSTPYSRFSTIRKLTGAYPWTGAPFRNISIIGKDRAHCIVRAVENNYDRPPAEIVVNGVIKNMTFSAVPNALSEVDANATKASYAVHIDAEVPETIEDDKPSAVPVIETCFEECIFEGFSGPAVGAGLHSKMTLKFKNCEFSSWGDESRGYNTSTFQNLSNYGVFFCHTSPYENRPSQKLILDGCKFKAFDGGMPLIRINATEKYASGECYIYAYNNTVWNEYDLTNFNVIIDDILDVHPSSHGNNVDVLNA